MSKTLHEIASFWKRQRRNWRIVVIRAIFSRFFIRLTMDYNNIYIRGLGASPLELGSINSVTHVANTVVSAPLGWLHDRYSLRKIFLISLGLFTISPLFYALAQDWAWIGPAMLLAAFAWPCIVICDVCLRSGDRAMGKALCEVVGSAPSLIAPTIAALLITVFGGLSVEGIRPLYWLQFAGQCALLIYALTQMTEVTRPSSKVGKTSVMGDFREVFERGTALKRWIVFETVGMFITSMTTPFRAPFANEVQAADQFIIGGMASASLLIQVLFATPLGRLADRKGRKKVFYALIPLYWASNLLLVFAPTPEILIASGALLGFHMITNIAVQASIRAELVPIDCIGRWRGILRLFGGLASILASIVGGIVWEVLGPAYVFLIPVAVDVLLRTPLLASIPETLTMKFE